MIDNMNWWGIPLILVFIIGFFGGILIGIGGFIIWATGFYCDYFYGRGKPSQNWR